MTTESAPLLLEGRGLDYERYALNKLFHRLASRHGIRSVLEIPAKGEKAMPSLYSIGFGEAGCKVTLVNAEEKSKLAWQKLGFDVTYQNSSDLNHTGMESEQYDVVWNFQYLARHANTEAMLAEMVRLSRKYVLYVAVNKYNPGFYSHRLVHRIFNVPWNHGDFAFMNPFHVSRWLRKNGLKIVKVGLVDTPPFPDSLGIRDIKLHRINRHLNKMAWESRTLHWMKQGEYPLKLKFLYLFEKAPLPFLIKLIYAHLFYVLAEK